MSICELLSNLVASKTTIENHLSFDLSCIPKMYVIFSLRRVTASITVITINADNSLTTTIIICDRILENLPSTHK